MWPGSGEPPDWACSRSECWTAKDLESTTGWVSEEASRARLEQIFLIGLETQKNMWRGALVSTPQRKWERWRSCWPLCGTQEVKKTQPCSDRQCLKWITESVLSESHQCHLGNEGNSAFLSQLKNDCFTTRNCFSQILKISLNLHLDQMWLFSADKSSSLTWLLYELWCCHHMLITH